MKCFQVDLKGENFLLNLDGEPRKFGFTLSRYLRAENAAVAEKTAIILARQLPTLKQVLVGDNEDPPRIIVQKTRGISPLKFAFRRRKPQFELHAEEDPL